MTYLSKGKIHKYIQAILESLKGKKKSQVFQNCSTDLLSETQVQSHSFTGYARLGLLASSGEQCLPMGNRAAPALCLSDLRTNTAWIREAPTQDFHPGYILQPQGARWSTALHAHVPASCSQGSRVEAVG